MVAVASPCRDRDPVWRTSGPHLSSSVTVARATVTTTRRRPRSGSFRSRTTNNSSGHNNRPSRLAICSREYPDARFAPASRSLPNFLTSRAQWRRSKSLIYIITCLLKLLENSLGIRLMNSELKLGFILNKEKSEKKPKICKNWEYVSKRV